MSLTITVTDNATPRIQALIDKLSDRTEAHRALGEVAVDIIQTHFAQLHAERNKHTRFYEEAGKGTLLGQVDDAGAKIEIHRIGIAQRYFGGPIDPKYASFLTIPAHEDSYGKTAADFGELEILPVMGGSGNIFGALVQLEGAIGKRGQPIKKREGNKVLFWLAKHVDQDADPTVLPEPDEIKDATLDVLGRYFSN